jgi:putative alpha-1,2-mannosidase
LVDAYVKGLNNGIDWDAGYAAVQKDAEEEPYDWSNEGRGGLQSWKELNYIPVEDFDYLGFGTMTRSISRTLEYSYNDFAIAQMARGLNKTGDAEKYEKRSESWKNLFKEDQTSFNNGTDTGFTGDTRILSNAQILTTVGVFVRSRILLQKPSSQVSGNISCT